MKSICTTILLFFLFCLILAGCQPLAAKSPIKIGLIAPFTGPSALSGEATQRGMLLAVEEINAQGGVLGRPLEIVMRNVNDDPKAGRIALRELIDEEQIVAVFGGIFNNVLLEYLDVIHEKKIPLFNPWGSLPAVTKNGYDPNYSFCIAVGDKPANEFLAKYAVGILQIERPAIMAENSLWGDSNVQGLTEWLTQLGHPPVIVERFDPGNTTLLPQVTRMHDAGANALMLVAGSVEGAVIVRGMTAIGWRAPVISHWGISGGQFAEQAGPLASEGVYVLQTFSFFNPLSARGEALLSAYHKRFGTTRIEDIVAPVGVVHGYDGMHLLAQAIEQAGSTDGAKIKDALEGLESPYEGVLKRYESPFSPKNHHAFTPSDYMMAQWKKGRLAPALPDRLERN